MNCCIYKKFQNFKNYGLSDWLFRLLQTPLDWLRYIQSSGYKPRNKLILKLTKRGNHELISISTILKLSALGWELLNGGYRD